jgi:hypothetical protein
MQKLSVLPEFDSVKLLSEDNRKRLDFIRADIRNRSDRGIS